MIHHAWFDHQGENASTTVGLFRPLESHSDWKVFLAQHKIKGRFIRESKNDRGDLTRQYAHAAGSTKITVLDAQGQVEIVSSTKPLSDAIIGIHRQRGYHGSWVYILYAFLLDVMGLALILFAITGVIMWFKLLKHKKMAWIIFIAGLLYCVATIFLLMYW